MSNVRCPLSPGKSLGIRCWSAWSPGLTTALEWAEWSRSQAPLREITEKTAAAFVPALVRRRCSNLTRASLEVAHACMRSRDAASVESVFSSRHGEGEVTLKILNDLAQAQSLSPNDFSVSVHNTSSGLFSIFSKNRLASTTVSSSESPLDAALFEVANALQRNKGSSDVLAVISDMPCADVFEGPKPDPAFAIAILFCSPENDAPSLSITGTPFAAEELSSQSGTEPRATQFLRWAFLGKPTFPSAPLLSSWELKVTHGSWSECFEAIDKPATRVASAA